MAMKRTIRRGLASPAICWGLGIWTAVGCVLSAPALVQQPGSGVEGYVQTRIDQQINALQAPWFRHFLSFDPAEALRQTRVSVLALFGGLDLQVIAVQNRGPMAEALLDNPDVTIEVLPRANHLFQAATTGSPAEYAKLEKTFVDGFLDTISNWILTRCGG